ncbi:MAG: site-specific DNA-methyltransferase [Dehalogenimonas sp.]|uniref:Site-specific DNA-methyltransferase n=1 Tax=Candidatus Dehalogenimonas loeffleri TaxID=3127115 RepID=A0ABZ2J7A6_9CHLR|nr:site-specific DNA-methyltransferase [Dehalogenimonas sp.]
MDKMKMHSPNLTQENIARIRELFPGCVTEAKDEAGRLKLGVDFDLLRQELSESIVEGPQERYHLNWPGKREALITANAPIAKTLRPCREESVGFDTTKNLFIEGDNLDALKLIQETYLGKVKMIYIDPPYNTGNDFIYEDDFAETSGEFLKRSNQKDEEGNRLVANTEANGRFHSDWLSMIYPRLKLARNLLRDDGVIFISIDENEVHNVRKVGDEIFGSDNFISDLIWQKRKGGGNDSKFIAVDHEFIMIYGKSVVHQDKKWRVPYDEDYLKRYKEEDYQGIFYWDTLHRGGLQSPIIYDVECPDGSIIKNGTWQVSERSFREKKDSGQIRIIHGKDDQWTVQHKVYQPEGRVFRSIYSEVTNSDSAKEIKSYFGFDKFFENPKPTLLIRALCYLCGCTTDDIVLDFFAGSATTADAVMQLNAIDGAKRKFILVQIPEPCDEKSESFKAGYNTITEISKDRIRRAGEKILEGECHEAWNKDIGFRVLKVDSSNMADVYYTPDSIEQAQLKIFTGNIKPDRNPEDLLFQVLLDWGVDLSLPIRRETIQDKTVLFVNQPPYDLIACFDTGVNEDLVKELAKFEPLRVVFRDSGFVSDAVKINVEQIFKQMSPSTEVKSI